MIRTKSKGVPNKPRYDLIKKIVIHTLLTHCSNELPISLEDIVDKFHDIELRSYSWYQKTMNVSLDYVVNSVAKSEDGSLLDVSDGTGLTSMIILYDGTKLIGRKRFTIAHELGHYLLKHNELTSETIISRGGFNEPEYDVLEKEANFFARMLLAPLPLLTYIAKSWGPINQKHLVNIFKVTYTVAGNVINHISNQQKRGFLPTNENIVNKYKNSLNRFINIHTCNNCHSEFIWDNPIYCPICKNNNLIRITSNNYDVYHEFERSDYMIYDGIEVDKDSKAIICPICENEEPEDGDHCSICGQYLINKCTNVDHFNRSPFDGDICGELLAGNARHCTHCSAQSTFLQNGLLKPWYDEDEEVIPF